MNFLKIMDKSMTAGVTDVHRILAGGSEVCKKSLVIMLDSNGGQIIPGNSKASEKIQTYAEEVLAEEDCKPTKMRVERVSMCSTIRSTKRPPKRKQKQARETDARPRCKPGSCARAEMGESGAPAGSAQDPEDPTDAQRPRVAKSVPTPTLHEHWCEHWCEHCELERLQLDTKRFHAMRRVKYQ